MKYMPVEVTQCRLSMRFAVTVRHLCASWCASQHFSSRTGVAREALQCVRADPGGDVQRGEGVAALVQRNAQLSEPVVPVKI